MANDQQGMEGVIGAEVTIPILQKLWGQSSWLTQAATQSASMSSCAPLSLI